MDVIETERLDLVLQSAEQARAFVDGLTAEERAEMSSDWLARVQTATVGDPWTHPFMIGLRSEGVVVGVCGFKAPPAGGVVEIAYSVELDRQGNGYATEAAAALVAFALGVEGVDTVRAHTLPEENASTRVLEKCGFTKVGDVVDPDDGPVWRWERRADG